jgi:histone-lysine N-methyltransferase SETMAR
LSNPLLQLVVAYVQCLLCDVITGDESWFYHTQIGRKSSNAAWVRRGDPSPTVVWRDKFAPRTLFSIFFKSDSTVLIHPVERGQAIDHHYYINNCLRPLIEQVKCRRPSYGTRAIKIHHDNGRPHVPKDVSDYLESEGLTIIPNHPNSPDLSPCDFWLFDLIKENLTDQSDSESLYDAVSEFMYSINKEEYRKTFEKRIQRMQLYIDNQGDYFEHLIK